MTIKMNCVEVTDHGMTGANHNWSVVFRAIDGQNPNVSFSEVRIHFKAASSPYAAGVSYLLNLTSL